MKYLIVIAASFGMTACVGPNPELGVIDARALPAETQLAAANLPVLETAPEQAVSLGEIDATSCKNKIWSPDPSEEDALRQLKIKASDLGADALTNVQYDPSGTSLLRNCWSSIRATATAVKLPD